MKIKNVLPYKDLPGMYLLILCIYNVLFCIDAMILSYVC